MDFSRNDMLAWWESSQFSGSNAEYVEQMFESYVVDPQSVPEEWRMLFDSLPSVPSATRDSLHTPVIDYFKEAAKNKRVFVGGTTDPREMEFERKQVKVLELVSGYRHRGHTKAKLDPLGIQRRSLSRQLALEFHSLSETDLDTEFQVGTTFFGFNNDRATLREILDALERTYAGTVGVETSHITDLDEKRWLQERIEIVKSHPQYSNEKKLDILERLTAAEGLEKHLDSKYPGVKRFGLEGGESLIPLLDALIQKEGEMGAKEIVMAMAHRGRLNVLINILGKDPSELFDEFEGKRILNKTGDVKYHLGFSSNVDTKGGEVHLAMAFNPSHLEIASPVAIGSVRARQDRRGDKTGEQVVPIIMHGDAAFAGQGVVMETFQMSQTRAYGAGGTIHIVINNQVGFTTSKAEDARSSEYCTQVASMVQAPVFHVNADDPEAVIFVAELASDYRDKYHKDIVIDLVCYRRKGHNETDEPSSTQPLMYKEIKRLPTTRTQYADALVQQGVLSRQASDDMVTDYRARFERGETVARSIVKNPNTALFVDWTPYLNHDWDIPAETGCDLDELTEIAKKISKIPEDFAIQRQVSKVYEERQKMADGKQLLNWGMAELLAYATLATSGFAIRMTGQDSGRGTFSHRHAVLHDQNTGESYQPLNHITDDQRTVEIFDSLLSEEGVLAFEYGYATTTPNALVVWEAQFGDFANGAQVVIDQFITSGEHKWQRLCGLTMLLPHGYEGQGAEHSSARLERFLQMCAGHNIQVVLPTTPAQIFHLLRRQAIRPMRRPLVIMSPKWILRHKLAVSPLEDLANGSFQNAIGDDQIDRSKARKIVLCSGKVYYHLLEAREERGIEDIALVRIEQLYPFPHEELMEKISGYDQVREVVWCQEEPINQGAWYCSYHHFERVVKALGDSVTLSFAGREASAAPACGYMSQHLVEQKALIDEALS